MRRVLALPLVGLFAAAPLAAQWEGTVSMKVSAGNGQAMGDMLMKVAIKDGKSATLMSMPSNAGPMAGTEMRAIYDPSTNTSTILMPIPAGMANAGPLAGAKGMKIVTDLTKMQAAASAGRAGDAGDFQVKPLGTK